MGRPARDFHWKCAARSCTPDSTRNRRPSLLVCLRAPPSQRCQRPASLQRSSRPPMTSKDKTFYALAAAFAGAVTYAIVTIFLRTPAAQLAAGGLAQKIVYAYVGVTMGIYVTGGACGLASAMYLVRPSETANAWARSGSDCAALFGALVLCGGLLWHKKAGGVYWRWDLQLTTTVLSVLVYWAICV